MTDSAFELSIRVALPAHVVWSRLIDLDRHSAAVPFTTVTPVGECMRAGLRFVGDTNLGLVHVFDRMLVGCADAPTAALPGRLVVEKFGPVAGRVEAIVEQTTTGTLLTWRQSLEPAWLPRWLRPVAARVAGVAYGAGIRRIVR